MRHCILAAALTATVACAAPRHDAAPRPPFTTASPVPGPTESPPPGIVDAAEDVREYFDGPLSAVYGGIYEKDGGLVVLVTRDAVRHAAALRARVPWVRLTFRTVRFALARLDAVQDRLTQRIESLPVSGIGVDEEGNAVVVGLPKDTPATRAAVLRALGPRDRVVLRFEEAQYAVVD